MTSGAPAHIRMRDLLVLGVLLEVARRVPPHLVRVPVAEHAVLDEVDGEGAVRDDLSGLADGDVAAGHVLPERGPRKAEADGLAQREVDERELALPLLDREAPEHVGERLRRAAAMPRHDPVDLLAQPSHPLRVLREEDL